MSRLVEVQCVTKSFVGPDRVSRTILDVETFALDEGELLALEGESGSGKTTFLHLLAGILVPDAGSITVAGTELTKLSEPARDLFRAKTTGYVFQSFNLMQGLSALENVEMAMRLGGKLDRKFALGLLERVGLADRRDHRPRQLSVGQQQRVAVARALANRPRLVLADEPTGSLDAARAEESLSLMMELCKEAGSALLLVSHDRQILDRFPRCERLAEINRAAAAR